MPRVYHVSRARKDYPAHGVRKGQEYWWWEFRDKGMMRSTAPPRPSQLVEGRWSAVLCAQEDIQDASVVVLDDFIDAVRNGMDILDDVAEDYRDAAAMMPGAGRRHARRADHLLSLASELRQALGMLEALYGGEAEDLPYDIPTIKSRLMELDWALDV